MAGIRDMSPNVPEQATGYLAPSMFAIPRHVAIALVGCVPLLLHAQPSFVGTHGFRMDERGAGVAATASGFRAAVGAMHHPGLQTAEVWTFSSTGSVTGQIAIGPAGQCFVQAGAVNAGGQYFVAGSAIRPDSSQHDAMLVKLSSTNTVLFAYLGDAAHDQQFMHVAPLPDGGAIACGTDNAAGMHQALVSRIDPTGALVWTVVLPSTLSTEANAVAVNGSIVMITGSRKNFGGTTDCYFARLDLNGTVVWTTSWGNPGNDAGEAIVSTSASTFVMAGHCGACGEYDHTEDRYKSHMYAIGIDLNGDTTWTAVIGDTLFDRKAFAVDVTTGGDLLIGGERQDLSLVDADVFRTNDSGQPMWEKAYDAAPWDRVLDLRALSDGFVAIGWSYGAFSRQVLMVRKDQNGE